MDDPASQGPAVAKRIRREVLLVMFIGE